MFRKFLCTSGDNLFLELNWIQKINGLVRVAIFDEVSSRAFVVVFLEKENKYSLFAFDTVSGEIYWKVSVVNGGYGSPALLDDSVLFPTRFTNIIACSKENGEKKWEFETTCRIRSSINVIDQSIYFSSGGTIFSLDSNGKILKKWEYPGAFFYGTVDVIKELILTLGTIENDEGESVVKIFAFHREGMLVYQLPLYVGPIISSDTAGIAWKDNFGFVGGADVVFCFEAECGRVIWTSKIEGFAGRQICAVDSNQVYYVTQSGIVGALTISTGSPSWQIKTQDDALVAPISILGKNLVVLSDAHVNILKSSSGQIIQKVPVGHSPYSMLSLNEKYALLGAGEPPHNGLLFGFKLSESLKNQSYICVANSSNNYIDEKCFDLLVNVSSIVEEILSIQLDGKLFNLNDPIEGEYLDAATFSFKVSLPSTICPGEYVIPIYISLDSGKIISRAIAIELLRKKPLPSRAFLSHIPDIVQQKPNFSGAAIGSVMKKVYGDNNIEQSDIREMVDASRQKAKYEPHETWRLIFRRVLTSRAKKLSELSEFKN